MSGAMKGQFVCFCRRGVGGVGSKVRSQDGIGGEAGWWWWEGWRELD